MAVIIPNVTNWSVTPQNWQEDYFTKMNIWLSESTAVIASLSTAITKINESNTESNDNLEEVLTARDQTVAARNEAVTAVATLTAGAIDDTTIASNKAFSNEHIIDNYYDKDAVDSKTIINDFADKLTPIDTDHIGIQETGGLLKKLSFANLKNWILSLFQPTLTGTVSFNATTNNISLTNIVTALGLEIGDVIQISGANDAKNNSEFTVEVITDNNNIIVNQAHANKGTSKNVVTRSGDTNVTVKLLAKWYNAPIGLGQDWVDVKNIRTYGTSYPNNTNRTIKVHISPATSGNTSWGIALKQGSSIISQAGGYTSTEDRMSSCNGEIVAGANYSCAVLANSFTGFKQWMELR